MIEPLFLTKYLSSIMLLRHLFNNVLSASNVFLAFHKIKIALRYIVNEFLAFIRSLFNLHVASFFQVHSGEDISSSWTIMFDMLGSLLLIYIEGFVIIFTKI